MRQERYRWTVSDLGVTIKALILRTNGIAGTEVRSASRGRLAVICRL